MPTINWESCAPGGTATLSCVPMLFEVIVFWALVFAGIVAFFLIILSGYKFMNSGGDPKAADSARKTLTYAVLGLLLVFLSFFIIETISTVTGTGCILNFYQEGFSACIP
jgi:heme O synthase-like polyprenyltransferase